MNFTLQETIELLERTPAALTALLAGLSAGWLHSNEGEGTWNADQVVDHLIEAERTNWLPRLAHILEHGESEDFPPFDRFAHLNGEAGGTLEERLLRFRELRASNLDKLRSLVEDRPERLELTGKHPAFGVVKARELVATWAVHDMTHLAQIARVLAEHYRTDVGPWTAYLGILNRK